MRTQHLVVLHALADHYDPEGFGFVSFAMLMKDTGLSRSQVRRSCRLLQRNGMAQFYAGLWSEDGEPRGAGYACTKAGLGYSNNHKGPNDAQGQPRELRMRKQGTVA